MSNADVENLENEGGPAPAEPAAEPAGAAAPAAVEAPAGVKPEDFSMVVEAVKELYGRLPEPEVEEEDLSGMDTAELMKRYVDQRLGDIQPVLESTVEARGQERLKQMHAELKKDPEIGDFDEKVAEFAAQAYLGQGGDPVQAVVMGAKYAADYRKNERASGRQEYKDSISKTPYDDPGVSGGGEHAPMEAKDYDEVISKWSGQEEV